MHALFCFQAEEGTSIVVYLLFKFIEIQTQK